MARISTFDVPAAVAEIGRQPIEQFEITGYFGLRAKILDGLHQTDAKDLLPEAIHGETRATSGCSADISQRANPKRMRVCIGRQRGPT